MLHHSALWLWPPNVLGAMTDTIYPFCNQTGGIALATVPAGTFFSARVRNSLLARRHYAVPGASGQRNASPVINIRCMITDSLRARATQAFLWLLRFLMRRAQSLIG